MANYDRCEDAGDMEIFICNRVDVLLIQNINDFFALSS
jgi:hypothetical protein